MDRQNQERMCFTHKDQKCIVVNIDPDCDPNSRHCCSTCLLDNKHRIIKDYEQAKAYLKEHIKAYKREKEAQNRQNLESLNQVSKQIQDLKNYYNNILDQLSERAMIQAQFIDEEQMALDSKLQAIDIDSFLSSSNELAHQAFHNKGFQTQFQEQIEKLTQQDVIQGCLNQLEQLDNRVIKLQPPPVSQEHAPDERLFQTQNQLIFSFPCPQHNEDVRFILLNEKDTKLACEECLTQNQLKPTRISQALSQWMKIKDNTQQQTQSCQNKFKTKYESVKTKLKEHEKQYSVKIENVGNTICQIYFAVEERFQKQQKLFNKDWTLLTYDEALEIAIIISNSQMFSTDVQNQYDNDNEQLNSTLETSLVDLKNHQQDFLDQFIQMIGQERSRLSVIVHDQDRKRLPSILQPPQEYQNPQNDEEKRKSDPRLSSAQKIENVNYQKVQQSLIVINDVCNAMAMNTQSTVLVAGCGKVINVYEFLDGKLKFTQLLNDHTGDITALYFMKNTNQFISGSADNSIRVWSYNNNFKQYGCDFIIKAAHSKPINQILVAKNESLLISCSSIVKIWNNKPKWNCWQQVKGNLSGVYSISLNDAQDTLVATGYNGSKLSFQSGQICIIKPDHQGMWQIVQVITTRKLGFKISFINNKVFAFSKEKGGKLHLYEYNDQQKQYTKSKFIKIDAEVDAPTMTLPQTFNSEAQLIVNQHGKSINLIKVKGYQEFEIQQTIKFETNKVSGVMSDNGQYLITWDNFTHEVTVRSTLNS